MTLCNTPTVAILLSNYNGYPYLYSSLEGICNQTHPADEIIIVDDGSTDKSLQIINKYAQKYKNIKIIINEKNMGLLYSINKVLNEAKSDYIVWAASDDFLMPYFLERSLEILKEHPEAGICFSQFAVFIDGTTQKRIYSPQRMGNAFDLGKTPHFLSPEMFFKRLQRSYLWMSGNTVLARRTALLEMGGFLPSLRWHADWFSFLVIAMRYGVCIVPEVLTFMREVPLSYSRAGIKDKKQQKKVLTNILLLIYNENFKDVLKIFRSCPCLFSPFGKNIFFVMIRNKRFYMAYKYARFYFPHIVRNFIRIMKSPKTSLIKIYYILMREYMNRMPSLFAYGKKFFR